MTDPVSQPDRDAIRARVASIRANHVYYRPDAQVDIAWLLGALEAVEAERDAACALLREVLMEAAINAYVEGETLAAPLLGRIGMFLHDAVRS